MTFWKLWEIELTEKEAMKAIDENKKVFIEDGCLNDSVYSYKIDDTDPDEKRIAFITSNCVFPKEICLQDFENVDCSWFEDSLFIQVHN